MIGVLVYYIWYSHRCVIKYSGWAPESIVTYRLPMFNRQDDRMLPSNHAVSCLTNHSDPRKSRELNNHLFIAFHSFISILFIFV